MRSSASRISFGAIFMGLSLVAAACTGAEDVEPADTSAATTTTVSTPTSTTAPVEQSTSTASTTPTTSTTIPIVAGVTVETVVAELDAAAGGLSVDSRGYVYSADFGYTNHRGDRVYVVDPEGEVSVYFSDDALWTASGNTIGPDGLLYQSSFSNDLLLRINADGTFTEVAEDVEGIVGVAVAEDGTTYVASCREDVIERIDVEGNKELFAFDQQFNCPNGLILAPDGNLYMANFGNGWVHRITMDGEVTPVAELPGANNGHLAWRDGELIVAARGANQILGVSLDGSLRLIAGSGEVGIVDGPGPDAAIGLPNGVAIGPDGEIYVNHPTNLDGVSNNPKAIRVIWIDD